jgi:hypothetical protein
MSIGWTAGPSSGVGRSTLRDGYEQYHQRQPDHGGPLDFGRRAAELAAELSAHGRLCDLRTVARAAALVVRMRVRRGTWPRLRIAL